MGTKPRRQRKGDRLLNNDARRAEVETDHAVAPFDRMARQMEMMWGIDRLPELVTPELAARYGAAVAYLNECIAAADPAKTIGAVNNCLRGMQAMDAEARAHGHAPATGEFWEYEMRRPDGGVPFRFAIMRDGAEWQTAKARRPDLQFYTLQEVACALEAYAAQVPMGEIREKFPRAQITKITPPVNYANGGDEIPF